MGDKILAGYETLGRFEPIQLYAGERPVVTTQGTLTAGQKIGQLNARNETFKFGLVAELANGKLVKFNPAGNDGSELLKGVLPHALDTTATGYNADVDTSIILDAVLNFEAMDIGAATYAQARAYKQAPGSNITFQKLY